MEISQEVKQMNDDIVDRLVAYRKRLQMTQQDIANATGIHRANIARMENKKNISTLESLQKYAKSVGVELKIELKDNFE